MDSDSMVTKDQGNHNFKDVYDNLNNGNNQEVIVVDGRGYEGNGKNKKEIYTLVDVIEDAQTANNLNEEIIKRAAEIVEKIAREMVPEIAERVIKEEIEKLKIMSGAD
ncbi:MAG: hypothetical protein NTW65_02350 [Deltaproteobacteria bacterium]|nr:hypothetical protein [Deltaproteobacteria bacterium]